MEAIQNKKLIDVWLVEIPKFSAKEDVFFSLLSDGEKKRAKAFVTKKLTLHYTISQAVLRIILSKYLATQPNDVVYSFGEHKKPFLKDNPLDLQFNLTHSSDFALVAVSLHDPVGVDIEKVRDNILEKGLEKTIFTDHELATFSSLALKDRAQAFFAAWTHKEALVKLAGVGLYKELKELEVPLELAQETTVVLFEGTPRYLKSFAIKDDYIAAVASTKPQFDLSLHHFEID